MGNCCSDNNTNKSNSNLVSAINSRTYALNASDIDAIMQYCQNLKGLSHPNVKPLTSFTHANSQLIMNSNLLEDTDLHKYLELRKNNILQSQTIKHIIRQLCSGLQYLHSKQIIHGELNLKNVEINPANNDIQIMNISLPSSFGLKLIHNQSSTKEFESPEKQKDETLTKQSDLYSLGAIGLTLYGITFSQNLQFPKPANSSSGLFEKLKALTNQTPQSRPSLEEIFDALDLETNPSSSNNAESPDKNKNNQNDQVGVKSNSSIKNDQVHQNQINAQIVNSQQSKQASLNQIQQDNKQSSKTAIDKKQQPKSEVIYRKSSEKIEYDFNPFSVRKDKDIKYMNQMKKLSFFQDHSALVTSIISDKNGQYVYTSSCDGSIIVYQFNEKQKQLTLHKKLNDFEYGVSQMILTKDNNYLIAADLGSNIYIYATKDFKLHKKISNLFDKSCILSIDISQDNNQLLVSATYKKTILCTLNNFEISKKQNIEGLSSDANVSRFFQNNIVLGENSGKLLVYSKDNLVTPIKELNEHTNAITQISVNGDIFAVSSQDKNITIYDKSFTKIQTLNSHIDCVSNISIQDNSLTSNGWDGSTCLYLKDSKGQYELKSCFPNETSWSVSSIYFQQSKLLMSIGGRFLFIFA